MGNLNQIDALKPWKKKMFVGLVFSHQELDDIGLNLDKLTQADLDAIGRRAATVANTAIKVMMK